MRVFLGYGRVIDDQHGIAATDRLSAWTSRVFIGAASQTPAQEVAQLVVFVSADHFAVG